MPLYITRAGSTPYVKIGFAEDVQARIGLLQCGNHETLHLLRTIDGTRATEAWMHRRFSAARVRSEWFIFDAAMMTIDPPALLPAVSTKTPHSEQTELLAEIESILPALGIAESTFGRQAVNDGKFVARLRRADNMTISTLDKAQAFLLAEKTRLAEKAAA